jgi:hypothetical protein
MTLEEMEDIFETHSNDYLKYDRVEPKATGRPDLDAFLLLHHLCPGAGDIVAGAEHDEIYLGVDAPQLAEKATEQDIITLIRCGVRYSEDFGLCMFV